MTTLDQLFLLDRLDEIINGKKTGKRKELANCLGIGTRSIHIYLDILRDLGADIKYCRERNSYIYMNDFRFKLKDLCNFDKRKALENQIFF